jgi:hypothetical protein
MRNHKFGMLATVTTIGVLTFMLTSLLWAKPKQITDQDLCSGKQTAVYSSCTANGGSSEYCWQASLPRYNQCMQAKGHAAGTYPPMQSPTPKPKPSVHPVTGGATNIKANSQSSPSPTAPSRKKHG